MMKVFTEDSVLATKHHVLDLLTPLLVIALAISASCRQPSQPESQEQKSSLEKQPEEEQQTIDSPQQNYINATGGITQAKRALVADLKRRYGGIDASVTEEPAALEHLARFARLMREWNPLQFYADDLKSIVGKPTKEVSVSSEDRHPNSKRVLTYWFDGDGYTGAGWEFTIEGKLIVGVRYLMGH